VKRLTRIQAVNRIIKIKTGERVTTQDELETIPQAVEASEELDMAVVLIMTEFKWFYNTVENGQLTADNNGVVTLPNNLTYITIYSTDAAVQAMYLRPVGGEIYDTYNHTNNIGVGKTVRYNGKMTWDFEDLPAAFQFLAIAQARKEIAGSSAHFSSERLAVEEKRFNEAFQTANKFDDTLSGGRLRGPMTGRKYPPHNHGII
jgi:hypothetical protein